MKEYEIWIGYFHLGQGHDGSTEPKLAGKETASDFTIACLKHELRKKLNFIEDADKKGQYISHQDREWFYDWKRNSNGWTGKYYETREEAQKSFGLN